MSSHSTKQTYPKDTFAWLLAWSALFCVSTPATAQTLYRCGSAYQDRPCETGQGERMVGIASSPKEAESGSVDAMCVQRGADAIKIVWRREGGATQEQALGQARSAAEKALVDEVYSVRGTAAQVRARVETDCMAEKERKARYDALTEANRPTNATSSNAAGDKNAGKKSNPCSDLAAKRDSIKSRQRTGGSTDVAEELNRSLSDAESAMRQNGCGQGSRMTSF